MKVLITGSNGFIGKHLIQEMGKDPNISLVLALRKGKKFDEEVPHSKFFFDKLDSSTDWSKALLEIDAVIHLAGYAHEKNYQIKDFEEECKKVNVDATINLAKQEGLDLIEISPNANPPVCKIIDIGKYKYDLQKKAHKAKKKQKISDLKEIKLRPGTEIHDYNFKIKNAQKFLSKKDKVKFTVRFKGREMQHHHLGMELLKRVEDDLKEVGKLELSPKFEGRQMTMVIQPL